jgi:hypothetical protein
MRKGKGIVVTLIAGLCAAAGFASACEQRSAVRGHWEWQGDGHVWVPDHVTLPPSAYAWRDDTRASTVREVAHDRDQRDAQGQPRDLDRRLTR